MLCWEESVYSTCGQARSRIQAGENPVPARQASHWVVDSGSASVMAKTKHRASKLAGRNRNGEVIEPRKIKCEKDDAVDPAEVITAQ